MSWRQDAELPQQFLHTYAHPQTWCLPGHLLTLVVGHILLGWSCTARPGRGQVGCLEGFLQAVVLGAWWL